MGHAIYGLGDEYVETAGTYTGAEPSQPNVTINTNRSTLKWGDLVLASTPLPTQPTPNCSIVPDEVEGLLPSGVIGLYEGAGGIQGSNCGIYRPDVMCHMNNIWTLTGNPSTVLTFIPFCKVCSQVITNKLSAIT